MTTVPATPVLLDPHDFRPGDVLEGLSGEEDTWPVVAHVGEVQQNPEFGPYLPVLMEGEEEPREFPVGSPVCVRR